MTEWWQVTLAIIGGALVFINFFNAVKDLVKSTKQPTNNLEERVSLIEKKLEFEIKATFTEYDARFGRDKQKIEAIEEGNRVTQQALLALLEHSIDGNNISALEKAKNNLNDYLIHK
jgi:hypothetical protein